ncbi:MAG: hypothetical protein LBH50_01785 [Spirochaetaceae bacterium]|jgi:hypothetical protein|nr:hypothetical protein [Spirochaetaceae bacterium]
MTDGADAEAVVAPAGRKIVFLPLPENVNIGGNGFSFNPSIPVPVEILGDSEVDELKNLTIVIYDFVSFFSLVLLLVLFLILTTTYRKYFVYSLTF